MPEIQNEIKFVSRCCAGVRNPDSIRDNRSSAVIVERPGYEVLTYYFTHLNNSFIS